MIDDRGEMMNGIGCHIQSVSQTLIPWSDVHCAIPVGLHGLDSLWPRAVIPPAGEITLLRSTTTTTTIMCS